MWNRRALKVSGKQNFKKNYWSCVAVSIVYAILLGSIGGGSIGGVNWGFSNASDEYVNNISPEIWMVVGMVAVLLLVIGVVLSVFGFAIKLLVSNPFEVGAGRYYQENRLKDGTSFSTVKAGFVGNYGRVVLTQFLRNLYIFLWSLLFIIPGIVRSYGYFAVPYILAENPNIDHNRALKLSLAMTKGYKWHIFVLQLSFILWWILDCFTLGILGIFYVSPYMDATSAEAYAFLREQALDTGLATADELPGFGDSSVPQLPNTNAQE